MANSYFPVLDVWNDGSYGILGDPMSRDSSNISTESMLTDTTMVTDVSMTCATPPASREGDKLSYSCPASPNLFDCFCLGCRGRRRGFHSGGCYDLTESEKASPSPAARKYISRNPFVDNFVARETCLLKRKFVASTLQNIATPEIMPWNGKIEISYSKSDTKKQEYKEANFEGYGEGLQPAVDSHKQSNLAAGYGNYNIPIIVPETDLETDTDESFDHDIDTDSLLDESVSQREDESLDRKVASVLGPEYAHLLGHVLDYYQSSRQEMTGFGGGNGSGSEPVSNSSNSSSQMTTTTKTPSTTDTSLSGKGSGGKRKSAGNGNDDDKPNDDDEGNPPKHPKVDKVPKDPKDVEPSWDCILFKLDPSKHSECGMGSFPFRHLWQHLERKHLACESCGRKLIYSGALRHLRNAQNDPAECVKKELNIKDKVDFIGLSIYTELKDIYDEKIPNLDKWAKWWKVLSSDPVPDPTHDDVITIPTSKIPGTLEEGRNLWNAEIESGKLPNIDKNEQDAILKLIGKAILLSPILRRKPRQPRTSSARRSNAGNSASLDHTTNWASGGSPWNGLDPSQSFEWSTYPTSGPSHGTGMSQTPRYDGQTPGPGNNIGTGQFPRYNSRGMLSQRSNNNVSLSPGNVASAPTPWDNSDLDQILGINGAAYDMSDDMNGYGYRQNSPGGNQ